MNRLALRVAILLLVLSPATAAAQQSIILVRHAERQTGEGDDSLSEEGRRRAERLSQLLRDAGVSHIFVSDRRRTMETAQPIARALNLTPDTIPIPAEARSGLDPSEAQVRTTLSAISRLPSTAVVLVVGHSNTVPMFLRRLGYPRPITIADTEFDSLFIVTPRSSRAPAVVRIRF